MCNKTESFQGRYTIEEQKTKNTSFRISDSRNAASFININMGGVVNSIFHSYEEVVRVASNVKCEIRPMWKGVRYDYTCEPSADIYAHKTMADVIRTDKALSGTPPYYDNSNGSLYKIAEQRDWNAYLFDVVKRLERGGKKDPLEQEIDKTIALLQLWKKELTSK